MKLIFYQVSFSGFTANDLQHLLFQEIPQAVHLTIEDFTAKNADFKLPAQTFQVAGLATQAKDSVLFPNTPKKRKLSFILFSFIQIYSIIRNLNRCIATSTENEEGQGFTSHASLSLLSFSIN